MATLRNVTLSAVVDDPHNPAIWRSTFRFSLLLLISIVLASPATSQTQSLENIGKGMSPEKRPAKGLSSASFERIRSLLALERQTVHSGFDGFDFRDDFLPRNQQPAIQLLDGLDFVGGITLFDNTDRLVPFGPPTHREMLNLLTPRLVREATAADALGVATASVGSLVPYTVTSIVRWFRDDQDDNVPTRPILPKREETFVLAETRTNPQVLDAGISQRERTVDLSLVVPSDTPLDIAQALGERFVLLVKTSASTESNPCQNVGTGNYDYILRIGSPTENSIAVGIKATSDAQIKWSYSDGASESK